MTITCDTTTRGLLDGAATKSAWTAALLTSLGTTGRRVVCKRDANAAAADVWSTGTTFRNVGATGTFATVGGKLSTLGTLRGTTVKLAAAMATGKSILRMTSADGSRWIQGTLGLSRKAQANAGIATENLVDYDFTVPKDFTATNGLGVTPNFAVGGRRFLPSGVGPAAPALDAGAPTVFEMWDWANPASPVKTGTITLDNRVEDFLYEDAEMAAINGDTAVYQSTQQLTLGEFAFGFTLLASHPSNTEVGNVPLYQVLGAIRSIKPSWASYPASDTYDFKNDNTFPTPFKVVAKNSAGVVIHTFELHDAKAINDPEVTTAKQDWYYSNRPTRPMVDCFTMLPWQNTRPRASTKLKKFYAGLDMTKYRPSMGRSQVSVNGCETLMVDGYSQSNTINGWGHIFAVKAWPEARGHTYWPQIPDPHLFYDGLNNGAQMGVAWCEGYAYEPGSFSCHNWYTGAGGVRFDRAFMPATLALWATDPTGNRPQDNTPWRDMADGFLFANFNHRNHWVRDVKSMAFTPVSDFKNGGWHLKNEYYSSGTELDTSTTIHGNSDQRSGTQAYNYDANGNMPLCGWGRDGQHNYANAGWGALLLNSPMHAIGSRWDTLYMLAQNGNPDNAWSGYMYRNQAWGWLHLTLAWKLASRHGLGINRAEIEEIFCRQLEAIYQQIYVPTFVEKRTEPFFAGIRQFGNPLTGNIYNKYATQGGWGYFVAGVLMLMKQTGMWQALHSRGGHIATALEMQLTNMDKNCFDGLLDTRGPYWNGLGFDVIPDSLAAWSAANEQGMGLTDLIHDAAGNLIGDREFGQWPMTQYVYIRRDYFPEFPSPRLAAAVAKMDNYLAIRAAAVAAAATNQDKQGADSQYALPGVFPIAPPTELGPA